MTNDRRSNRVWRLAVIGSWAALAGLALLGRPASAQDDEDLPPASEVFKYDARVNGDRVLVTYHIAADHYLYRQRMGFTSDTSGVTLGQPEFPAGSFHDDPYFGRQEIYVGDVTIPVPFSVSGPRPAQIALKLKLQGCNQKRGICYPPQLWTTSVALGPGGRDLLSLGKSKLSGEDLLPVDKAFRLSADVQAPERLKLTWVIADGYYLYRSKIAASTASPLIALGEPRLPPGETLTDDNFGTQQVYRGVLEVEVPFSRARAEGGPIELDVAYQGCAEGRVCYPLTRQKVTVIVPPGTLALQADLSEQDWLARQIAGPLGRALFWFFVGGLLLSLTPCVLPMVPILSGIIVAQGEKVTTARAFTLSLVYVFGMAVTYAVAGAVFALAGKQAQVAFQQPWVIGVFAGLFVFLALPMFGLFELQMPAFIQTRVANASNQQKAGTLFGTFTMGVLASLIVTTCVAPPLVGALTYIAQTGDVLRGASALFVMGIGMGAPLLLVGASAGKLLPKSGPWMVTVKAFFGVLFLGVAVYLLDRILPGGVVMMLWAALAFGTGYWLWTIGRIREGGGQVVIAALGLMLLLYGGILALGAAAGGTDPLQPLKVLALSGARTASAQSPGDSDRFVTVKTGAELDARLATARAAGRPVLVDFYADWCVSCKELETRTFANDAVIRTLAPADLVRVDVTDDSALLERFGVVGPPTLLFFSRSGTELKARRIVGFVDATRFQALATAAFADGT